MTSEERSQTIRQQVEADMRKTLHTSGSVSDFMYFGTYETLVVELVNDAMHHVEHLLAEIEDLKVKAVAIALEYGKARYDGPPDPYAHDQNS